MKKHFLLVACSFCLYASHAFAQNAATGQQSQTSTVNGATVSPGNETPAPAANGQKNQSSSVSTGTAATADGSTAPAATTDREQPVIVDTKENAGADPHQ